MKKKTLYKNAKTVYNGTTTIVYGELSTRPSGLLDAAAADLMYKVHKVHTTTLVGKGVSKLNPIDQYDENKGIMVASNKAELSVNRAMIRNLKMIIDSAQEYCAMASGIIEDLERRNDAIKSRNN